MSASVLLDEPFSYANGALVTVSGGNWTTHSGSTGDVEVVSGRVDLRVPASEDVNRLLAGQPYLSGSGQTLYASFTVNFSGAPSGVGAYFAHFKGSGTSNYRAKVFAFSGGVGAGQLRLGLAGAANSPVITNATVLNTNVDYRVYLRYVMSSGVTTLWIEPESEASPSVVATDATAASSLTGFALRQDSGIGIIGSMI